ncbi:MAG: diguanylate cyclase [Actinobacteria bacterium]|nr:diguanylate cyclase [Actinomycetota bacterium]
MSRERQHRGAATRPRRSGIDTARAALCAFVAVYAAVCLTPARTLLLRGSSHHLVSGGILVFAATLCALRVVRQPAQRATWTLVASGILCWGIGEILFAMPAGLVGSGPLSPANLLSLAFYPMAFAALIMMLKDRVEGLFTTLWLDGLAGALSACALVAAFVFPPVLANVRGSTATVAGDLSYPLADLLVFATGLFALAMTGWRPGRRFATAIAAFSMISITDAFSLWWSATGHHSIDLRFGWVWTAAALILVEVAWRPAPPAREVRATSLRLLAFPVTVSLTALGLLLSGLVHELDIAGYELAVSALVLLVVRLALTVLENLQIADSSKREALTDALTGLGNRRKLMLDVEEALAGGEPGVLVLFDLDGFKGYNDTFGHPAGDALLSRLGRSLHAAVAGYGKAYRLGGDEFCVLLRSTSADLDQHIAVGVEALSEQGQGFTVAPSCGSVVIPAEAADVSTAFQLADQRLYRHKGSRRRTRDGELVRDALIQALRERRPDLGEHLGGVARLAHAVARRLGMGDAAVDEVTKAAELHDIGKMAVPDAILEKPAALDAQEVELIRQHTVIGERILAVSPALRRVGKLVRHSHERWDGHGYPDRLVGEEIPLGARIIAVCDAFDAMTTDRPYKRSIPVSDALAELRRCAGDQFDPVVVSAFCVEAQALLSAVATDPVPAPDYAPEVFEEAWTLTLPAVEREQT